MEVVKCFNTLSAFELENKGYARRGLPIASNSVRAKGLVSDLINSIGYVAEDYGSLQMSRSIENIPLTLFPEWRAPLAISTLLWIFLYFLQFGRSYLCGENNQIHPSFTTEVDGKTYYLITNMLGKDLIKAFDGHALNMLAACYLPGVFAAYLQLFRGTKYFWFPSWLNNWMLMRKQFGLLMLLSASVHACYYCLVYTQKHSTDETLWTEKAYLTCGILGLALATILGITSLPSVSSSLSWREFRAIQSTLGWTCLVFSSAHAFLNGTNSTNFVESKVFVWKNCLFFGTEQVSLLLPLLTFALKIPLLFPQVIFSFFFLQ